MARTPPSVQMPPTPPVDPDNAEFVVFIRSKKLPSWIPMTIVKGGTAANVLVKTWESSNGTNTTARDTLIRNIGQVLDKDYPKAWYVPKGVFLIPPEEELPGTPIDNLKDGVTNFFSSLTGGSKEKTEKKKEESKATAKGF